VVVVLGLLLSSVADLFAAIPAVPDCATVAGGAGGA